MTIVVAVLSEPKLLMRIGPTLSESVELRFCSSPCAALQLVQRTDATAIVMDLAEWPVETLGPFIKTIRGRHADVPVIGVVYPDPPGLRRIVPTARAGITEIALVGIDDIAAVIASVSLGPYERAVARVISQLESTSMPGVSRIQLTFG